LMKKLQSSSSVPWCPYQKVLRTRGCDWMDIFNVARAIHWNVPNNIDEGPLDVGEDSHWCTICRNCSESEVFLQNSDQRGCVVQNYIAVDYTKDVEMQSIYANTTQETVSRYIDIQLPYHDVCIMSTGINDMKLTYMSLEKYVNNVEWFISLILPLCKRGIIWVEMSSSDNGAQRQKALSWNREIASMVANRNKDKFDNKVRVLRVMDDLSYLDNTYMTLGWYERLNSFLLGEILQGR